MLVCFYVLITMIMGNFLTYEIKSFHRNIIGLSNDLHYSRYRENHYGCVPRLSGLPAHSLSVRGILFLILKSFHSTPTHQSLSWAFWNESCSQQNQIESFNPWSWTLVFAPPTVLLLNSHVTETQVWGKGVTGSYSPFSFQVVTQFLLNSF